MAINFPSSPTQGQAFAKAGQPSYKWDINKWVLTGPGAPYETEAQAIFDAFTTPPTQDRKGLINDFVKTLKTGGVWNKLDIIYMLAAADAQAARVNWKQLPVGTYTLTEVNAPPFTPDQGYTGVASKYLDSLWDPVNNGVYFSQNSASLHLFCLTELASDSQPMIGFLPNGAGINPYNATGYAANTGINCASLNTFATWTSRGLFSLSRNSSVDYTVSRNGILLGTQATASIAMASSDYRILSATAGASIRQAAFGAWGAGLTAGEITTLHSAVSAYLLAVGALAVDTTAPTVVSFSPADNATNAPIASNLVATFSEQIGLASTGTFTLKKTSDNSTVQTWNLATDRPFGVGTIQPGKIGVIGQTQLTLRLSAALLPNTEYYVLWDANTIYDVRGNFAAAQASTTAWSFTTTAAITSLDLDLTNPATASQLTCVRSTTAWGERLDGTWQRFEINQPRITDKGLMMEDTSRANSIQWNRDLTNVAWTKTSTTVAKNQVGVDGVANSACSITATAANGTCTKSTTSSSGQRTFYAYVKRVTGSGTVEMQCQNAGYVAITPTATWTRYYVTPGGNTGSGSSGFRLGTSGDVIAVDFCNLESGVIGAGNSSSPRETTDGSEGTVREQDTVWADISAKGLAFGPTGTLFVQARPLAALTLGTAQDAACVDDNTSDNRIILRRVATTGAATAYNVVNAVNVGFTPTNIGAVWADATRGRAAMSISTGSQIGTKDAGAGATASGATAQVPLTTLRLGNIWGNGTPWIGWIERATVWAAQKTLVELQALTSPAPYDAFTTPPTTARKALIDACITSLMNAGVWVKLDNFYMQAGADNQCTRINWRNPGVWTLTEVNAPVSFTADIGWAGDNFGKGLDSGWKPSANGVNYTLNSASLHSWAVHMYRTDGSIDVGHFSSAPHAHNLPWNGSIDQMSHGLNSTGVNAIDAAGSSLGMMSLSRNNSANYTVTRNGVLRGTQTAASTSLPAVNFGSPTAYARRIGHASWGGALNATELTALHDAVEVYLSGIGAAYRAGTWGTTESTNIFASFTTPPTVARKRAIDDLVAYLMYAGIWTKLDAFYVFAAADAQAAIINWKSPGTYNASLVSAPVFTVDRGFAGASGKYIDTNFNPTTAPSPKFTQNNALQFGWSTQVAALDGDLMGNKDSTSMMLHPRRVGDTALARMNQGVTNASAASTDGSGLWANERSTSTASTLYKNGVSVATTAAASSALISRSFSYLYGENAYWAGSVAAGGHGQSLTAGEHTNLYKALRAYMTTVGVP